MGASASVEAPQSIRPQKLRNLLIVRAYNSRPEDMTLAEQLAAASELDSNGHPCLSQEGIARALRLEGAAPRISSLLGALFEAAGGTIKQVAFLDFLEKGLVPDEVLCAPAFGGNQRGAAAPLPVVSSEADCGKAFLDFSSTPANDCGAASDASCATTPALTPTSDYRDRPPLSLHANPPATAIVIAATSLQPPPSSAGGSGKALVKHRGTAIEDPAQLRQWWRRRRRPGAAVWRKRETVISERIVHYTSVEADGTSQELEEREKTQTEVLHMEARETGQFAHRETTEYESSEMFNGELVLMEGGSEEYVHLRSMDDEYEHLESSLPPRARAGAGAGMAGGGHSPEPEERESAAANAAAAGAEAGVSSPEIGSQPGSPRGGPADHLGQSCGDAAGGGASAAFHEFPSANAENSAGPDGLSDCGPGPAVGWTDFGFEGPGDGGSVGGGGAAGGEGVGGSAAGESLACSELHDEGAYVDEGKGGSVEEGEWDPLSLHRLHHAPFSPTSRAAAAASAAAASLRGSPRSAHQEWSPRNVWCNGAARSPRAAAAAAAAAHEAGNVEDAAAGRWTMPTRNRSPRNPIRSRPPSAAAADASASQGVPCE